MGFDLFPLFYVPIYSVANLDAELDSASAELKKNCVLV